MLDRKKDMISETEKRAVSIPKLKHNGKFFFKEYKEKS